MLICAVEHAFAETNVGPVRPMILSISFVVSHAFLVLLRHARPRSRARPRSGSQCPVLIVHACTDCKLGDSAHWHQDRSSVNVNALSPFVIHVSSVMACFWGQHTLGCRCGLHVFCKINRSRRKEEQNSASHLSLSTSSAVAMLVPSLICGSTAAVPRACSMP